MLPVSILHYNSHAHVERDNDKTTLKGVVGNYNSHAHVERDNFTYIIQIPKKNYNSHAHVERDLPFPSSSVGSVITTHTLTWSVTYSGFATGTNYQITTHTLTWSVTGLFNCNLPLLTNYNSHAHVERDNSIGVNANFNMKLQLTRSRGA